MKLAEVLKRRFPPVVQDYDGRDCALYALALGIGSDPLDEDELAFVYEGRGQHRQVVAFPTFAMTLAWPRFWQDDPATGIAWQQILHGEQHVRWHRPLPATGRVRGRHRIAAVEDKGAGRGLLIHFIIELEDADSGVPLAEIRQVQFLRGDGGCGSRGLLPAPCAPLPADAGPWHHDEVRTSPQGALLYRQASRDYMPLHADPDIARAAGFERPISHGLNNLGLAARMLMRRFAPRQPQRLRALSARFVAPGLPGDTVRVSLASRGPGEVFFHADAVERGVRLIDRGRAELGAA